MHGMYAYQWNESPAFEAPIRCSHKEIRALLMQQWKDLTPQAIEATGFVKRQIALLIEQHYGIHHRLAENYLSNLERTLPLSD